MEDPLKTWCQLGAAIAEYQSELFFRTEVSDPCTIPSLQPILDRAAELFGRGYGTVREIWRLHLAAKRPQRPPQAILAEVVGMSDSGLKHDLSSAEINALLGRQVVELNRRIRLALREMPPAPTASGAPYGDNQGVEPRLRLRVDRATKIAYLDDYAFPLLTEQASCYVAALVDARGEWRVAKQIAEKYPGFKGARTERVKKDLPLPIQRLIKTGGSKGSKIPLENLLAKQ